MTMELLLQTISEFRGARYPDIPLPVDFDKTELGDNPFFVTLPIGEVNAKSANGRIYPRSAVESIVNCINVSKSLGHWGHPALAERTQRSPAIQWLAALIDQDGVAWAKGYAISEDAVRLLRSAKALRRKIGTSIWGEASMDADRTTVLEVKLGYVDLLAEGEWGGVPVTSAVPVLTSEISANTAATDIQENDPMSEQTTLTLTQQIQELAAARDTAQRERDALKQERDTAQRELTTATARIAEMGTQVAELEQQRSELRSAVEQMDGIRQVITESADLYTRLEINVAGYGGDLIATIRDVIAKLQALATDKLASQMDAAVTEMVPFAEMRPVVRDLIGTVNSAADIKGRIEEVLSRSSIQALNQKLTVQEAGPRAISGAKAQETDLVKARAVADAEKSAERMGVRHRK